MRKFLPFIGGCLAALCIVLLITPALADSVLPGTSATINVRYSTIKTIINGKEFPVTSDDMIPFSYNGRTFVSLKFIAEAFGKDIYWDQATNSAIITDPLPFTNVYSDTLTTPPLSSDWVRSGTVNMDFDNGVYIGTNSSISLDKYFKRDARNFTVEFDFARTRDASTATRASEPRVNIGRMNDGKASDYVVLDYSGLSINGNSSNYPAEIRLGKNAFHRIKIDVSGGMIDVYINGTYITSERYKGDEMSIWFRSYDSYTSWVAPCYVRNFKLTVNE